LQRIVHSKELSLDQLEFAQAAGVELFFHYVC
jgi:hypothetical protein